MNNDILTCLQVLNSGSIDKEIYQTVLDIFSKFSVRTEDVAANREDTATVFYLLLSSCQKLFEVDALGKLPSIIQEKLLTSFSNIERLYHEASTQEVQTSYIKAIWFLSELKNKAAENRVDNISSTQLRESAESLLDILDDIRFLFDLKDDDGNGVFPIHKVIAAVIRQNDFMSSRRRITKEDIRVLQLAVRLFTSSESEALDTLRNKCNLGFIDFLQPNCEIIDTIDFLNYQYNGTIIFYRAADKTVLIRSEHKDYFNRSNEFNHVVDKEIDYEGNVIGWFIKYHLEQTDRLIDFSDLMREESSRLNFLKLMFDSNFYNVLLQKSIVRKSDGSLLPINPYCDQDKIIIKGKLNDRKGKIAPKSQVRNLLQGHRICSIKSKDMNYLTFGLCTLLLTISNSGVESLCLNQLDENAWYQEQVINNWIDIVDEDAVISFLNNWYKQLQYCDRNSEFAKVHIQEIDVLPLSQSIEKIYKKLWPSMGQSERVFCGTIVFEDGHYILDVSPRETVASYEMRGKEITIEDVYIDTLTDEENNYRWDSMSGTKLYFLYSPTNKCGHIVNTEVAKTVSGIEWILKTSLSYAVGCNVTDIEYEDTAKRMRLYSDAYKDVARKKRICMPEDLDSQIYLRILHNLIWSNVTVDTKDKYFTIIQSHQIADFEEIDKDPYFMRTNDTTLYLPKDAYEQGSVLSDIYEKRLKHNTKREPRSLYQERVTRDEFNNYYINDHKIEEIVLLTDNFINGASTKATLCAYLGIAIPGWEERIEEASETIHKLYCDGKQVSIKEIMQNNSAKLSVHGYYGTEEGVIQIDGFLSNNNIDYKETSYSKELTTKAEDIIIEAKSIWGNKNVKGIKRHHRLFIREYNMPKTKVFPDGMCGNLDYVICFFVSKPEFNQHKQ